LISTESNATENYGRNPKKTAARQDPETAKHDARDRPATNSLRTAAVVDHTAVVVHTAVVDHSAVVVHTAVAGHTAVVDHAAAAALGRFLAAPLAGCLVACRLIACLPYSLAAPTSAWEIWLKNSTSLCDAKQDFAFDSIFIQKLKK